MEERVVGYFEDFSKLTVKDYFSDWTKWEKYWIVISTIMITFASVLTWDNTNQLASWLSIISGISGIWCVLLTAKKRISSYIVGLVNVIAYAWCAYLWRIYGDFMLNAFYFLPMQAVGIYYWTKKEALISVDKVKGKKLNPLTRILVLGGSFGSVFLYKIILTKMGGNTPLLDATSTVFSVIAMILLVKRYMEQWILWIIVDVVSTVMWLNICFNEGGMMNLGLAIMWVLWTVNAVYGFISWKKVD